MIEDEICSENIKKNDYRQSVIKFPIFVIYTPFPTFPQGGRSAEQSFSPVGETGKGVI
jgi:hypothetical protein